MDFLSILNHTLPWSGAIARDFRLDKSSYVSETVKALERLKYPHKVSKTYLKMPGTRHGLNATIDIIEFLVDFGLVGNMSKIYKLSNNETEATSQLHSDEKVKLDSDQLMKNIENLQNVIQNENRQAHELELP
ncbi:uncharacterized protein Dwil_GK28221 [Drosophila willistoni]|uniref:Uncharacterized protein n=1 Tax=Drosophila willistoni TaxID=7260 RepID=A0A0Q9WRS8_DROWI|nr:uncharacterized protein Dwil_GK28221 [Drosophila willistoni]